jgi:hypothetical protein
VAARAIPAGLEARPTGPIHVSRCLDRFRQDLPGLQRLIIEKQITQNRLLFYSSYFEI